MNYNDKRVHRVLKCGQQINGLEYYPYETQKISNKGIPGIPEYWPTCPCKTCRAPWRNYCSENI